ncbi:MAG TPA: FAD-dependent oxidoreductase [Opitutus sp.]|nr:FAD-dependent oxidoreductase [Opitutus sp.]
MSKFHVQLAIAGSGFAGAIIAMAARQLGYSVVMLERGRHPRFAIGESSTPLANLLLEEIADEFGLPFLRSFSKWGVWQRAHPDIACGLKRGFTFYHHELGRPFPRDPVDALRRQLMVGASPHDRIADTHWYRPDFDHYLVRQAQALGVVYRDETSLEAVDEHADRIALRGTRAGAPFALTADFLIDATGPRGFLHRALRLPEKPIGNFPPTQALFSHFTGVAPLPDHFTPGTPPYPPEQAAVHHVFDGGWIWVLKFNNGITSAGVAATDPVAERFRLRAGEAAWRRLLHALPSLADAFAGARAVQPFVWQPRLAFQSAVVAGRRWALLPSAAGVVDPLLSTGFPLTLLGVQRLARLLKLFDTPEFAPGLAGYAEATAREFAVTAGLVGALYARMNRFDEFGNLSLLYFAAASYAESARRLGKSALAPDFLLCRHPSFGPQLRELCATAASEGLTARVRDAIAPLDVAGLTDRARHPWYPARAADLLAGAAKLDATAPEIAAMLQRCGFA